MQIEAVYSSIINLTRRKIALLGFIFFINTSVNAQCLISNGGFEQHTVCKGEFLDTNIVNWNNAYKEDNIGLLYGCSPDYFNSCFNPIYDTLCYLGLCVPQNFGGYQEPHSGTAYAGLYQYSDYMGSVPTPYNYREYVQTILEDTLQQGACYHFRVYCSFADNVGYFSPNIGAYFSDTMVLAQYDTSNNLQHRQRTILPFTPQINNSQTNYDTADWFLVEGYFTAHGGEKYIVIGNFVNDANTTLFLRDSNRAKDSYLFIDDVSLVRCDEEQIGSEIVKLCKGDSISLHKDNNLHPHGYCSWYDKRHKVLHNGFDYTIRPTTDTILYTIRGDSLTSCDLQYDSIIIRLINCDTIPTDTTFAFSMPTAFSPNGDGKNEVFYPVMSKAVTPTRFAIYNRWNELVYSYKNDTGWDGKYNGTAQPDGVYYYIIEINGEVKRGLVTVVR